jgi:hypothetical protein
MIFREPVDRNATSIGSKIDPYTWVLLAELALQDQREEEAAILIDEAFAAYDERRTDRLAAGHRSDALEELAEANA